MWLWTWLDKGAVGDINDMLLGMSVGVFPERIDWRAMTQYTEAQTE